MCENKDDDDDDDNYTLWEDVHTLHWCENTVIVRSPSPFPCMFMKYEAWERLHNF